MAKSLLDLDKEWVKKYDLPREFELPDEDKTAYIKEQAEQVAKVLWRVRVELMALEVTPAENEEQEAHRLQERAKLLGELKQYSAAIKAFDRIIQAL